MTKNDRKKLSGDSDPRSSGLGDSVPQSLGDRLGESLWAGFLLAVVNVAFMYWLIEIFFKVVTGNYSD